MDPSQRSSTGSEPESVAVTLISLEEYTDEKFSSWDIQASSIVFELTIFRCTVQNIQCVLQSYGFICSPQDLIDCIHCYSRFINHDKSPYLNNGPAVPKKFFQSGVESKVTVNHVKEYPTVISYNYEPLPARAPFWESYLYSGYGHQIRVKLTKGQVQTRVVDLPDLDHL